MTFTTVNTTQHADAAMVLGAAIWHDQPSPVFKERINHAIILYKQKYVRKIIFTGGKGETKQFSESEVAKTYAIKMGVDKTDILIESRSRTTIENIQNSLILIKQNNFKSILLVSDPWHMKRSITIAKDLGLSVYSSPTLTSRYVSLYSRLKFTLQEIYYYQRYLLFRI